MSELTYYERQLGVYNSITNLAGKRQFLENIDFSPKIEKDSDSKIVADLKTELDLIQEGILKEPKKEEKGKTKELTQKEIENILTPFRNPNLLDEIQKEISKDHLLDDNLKMTLFTTHLSGLLKNPKRRQSFQVTAKTSGGKDNIQKSSLKHFPDGSYLFLTTATQAVLEDDINNIPIIAISEINLFRDGGANKGLLEVIKQRIEGGTSSIKKDKRDDCKSVRFEKGEQGSVTFGTTESEEDDELSTRLMKGTILNNSERNQIVNKNTFEHFSNPTKILADSKLSDSWIKKGLTYLWKNTNYDVFIPYAKYLGEKINGKEIFDSEDARSQRDIKRLLSLTCAITWLYQEQRQKVEINGQKFLISEPEDFLNILKYSNEFFNQTYSGFDKRISEMNEFIKSKKNEKGEFFWVDKKEIQEFAKIRHRETLNRYLWALEQEAFIERQSGIILQQKYPVGAFKGNHIYYKSVHKAFNKCLISVQLDELKSYLNNKIKEAYEGNDKLDNKNKGINPQNEHLLVNASENGINENEHFQKMNAFLNASCTLTNQELTTQFTDEELKEAGITREQAEKMARGKSYD